MWLVYLFTGFVQCILLQGFHTTCVPSSEGQACVLCTQALAFINGVAVLVQDLPQNAPVVILLPGLTGGSGDSYIQVLSIFHKG